MRPVFLTRPLALILTSLSLITTVFSLPARAVPQESPAVRLLKSGKVPPERLGTVIGIVGRQGTASDFSVLLEKATDPKAFPRDIRIKALDTLADAAANRKIIPDKNREALLQVLPEPGQPGDIALTKAAIRNIIAWKLDQARSDRQGSQVARRSSC